MNIVLIIYINENTIEQFFYGLWFKRSCSVPVMQKLKPAGKHSTKHRAGASCEFRLRLILKFLPTPLITTFVDSYGAIFISRIFLQIFGILKSPIAYGACYNFAKFIPHQSSMKSNPAHSPCSLPRANLSTVCGGYTCAGLFGISLFLIEN